MAFDSHKNFGYSTVAATAPAISGTTMVLATNFSPAPTPPFNIVVWPAGANPTSANAEVCRVTANSSGTLTIVRAQESSSGRNIIVGDQVSAAITAKTITDIEDRINRDDYRVFYPEDYGAVGDGVTDDTVAVQAAIDAAAVAAQSFGATVQLKATIYVVNGTPRTDRNGNSILAFPTAYNDGRQITLRGPDGGSAWLVTASTAGYDATHGQPSLIGGPTNGAFTVITVAFENINVVLPNNPSISGIDLQWISACKLDNTNVSTNNATSTLPTHIRQFGLQTPSLSNQEIVEIGVYECFGCYTGLIANSEHMNCKAVHIAYGVNGVAHSAQSHANHIGYLSTWNLKYHLAGKPSTSNPVSASGTLVIDMWDIETQTSGTWTTVNHLYDGGTLFGHANVWTIFGGADNFSVTSGSVFSMRDVGLTPGYHAGLGGAASGTPMVVYRDTTYYVTGGTVTVIAVDGQTTGFTSGAFTVPSGRPFTITYSVAPTVKAICM